MQGHTVSEGLTGQLGVAEHQALLLPLDLMADTLSVETSVQAFEGQDMGPAAYLNPPGKVGELELEATLWTALGKLDRSGDPRLEGLIDSLRTHLDVRASIAAARSGGRL